MSGRLFVLMGITVQFKKWVSKRILTFVGVIGVVGLFGYSAVTPRPIPVDLGEVSRGSLQLTVDEDGKTRIRERYVVSAPLAGRTFRIELSEGDSVAAGETVLTRVEPTAADLLDPRTLAAARARERAAMARVKQTRQQLAQSESTLEFAKREADRATELLAVKAISQEQFDDKQHRARVCAHELEAAQSAVAVAEFERETAQAAASRMLASDSSSDDEWYFDILSPISGQLLRVFEESSTVVTPGTPLVEVGDPNDLEVVVDVLSNDAVRITPGAKVTFEHWGGDQALNGTVRFVEPSGFTKISALGVEEQRVNVVIDLDEPASQRESLGDGFRVEARIVVWANEDVLKVPVSALFRHDDAWSVFRHDGGLAVRTSVEVGHQNGLEAEILSGLEAGMRVILHPSDQVSDGAAIMPRDTQ